MNNNDKDFLGTAPIGKLLLSLALPTITAQLINMLYNIVDRIYIGHIPEAGALALTGVGVCMPLILIVSAFAALVGSGGAPRASILMGKQEHDQAEQILGNCFALLFLISIVLTVILLAWNRPILLAFGASENTIGYATDYMNIYAIGTIFVQMTLGMNMFITTQGYAKTGMLSVLIGAVINIILDPIMIFGLLGFPKLGVAGAALATVIGQIVASILALLFNIKKNEEITLRLKGFRPNAKVIGKIYSVGIPSIIMASIGSVMTFGMNKILISFTSTATAVFGVYFKLQSFVFMPIFGLNNGMVPIISYNYGARKPDRMMKTIKLSILYATCIMIIGVAIFMLIPDKLLSIFNASETMQQIGVPALRTISLSFVFAGFSICMLSVCQSLGHGMLSLSVSVVRQLVILLPTAYLLARFSGLNAVWWAFPFAELFSLALCLIYFRYIYGKEIKPLGNAS